MARAAARRDAQRGQAIVLLALMIVVLIGFVGLAVDSGRAYVDRRELQVGADSAALAAADRYVVSMNMAASLQAGASVFAANARITSAPSATWCPDPVLPPPTAAPFTTCTTTVRWSGDPHSLSLTYTDYRGIGKGLVFSSTASDQLAVTFTQALGTSPTVSIGATASTVIYDQGETPAILSLGRAPCNGSSGTSLTVQGGNGLSVTVLGSVYSDGGIGVGNGASVDVAGNAYENCGSTPIGGITNSGFGQYSPVTPLSTSYRGGTSLSQYSNYTAAASWPASSGNVEVSPGVYASDPRVTGGNPCNFLDPGMYTFDGGLTVNAGLMSNELRPPDEPVYNSSTTHAGALSGGNPPSPANASYLQFWRNNSVTCDGTFAVQAVTSSGGGGHPLTPGGSWGIEVTSARSDVAYSSGTSSATYTRESAPSMCRTVPVNGSNAGFQVAISNVPGAQWYNVYASPAGCGGPFGYAGFVCSGQTAVTGCTQSLTMSNSKSNCPNLPAFTGTTPLTPGPNQNAGTCTLGYTVSGIFDSSSIGGFGASGTPCTASPSPAGLVAIGCAPPDPELCPVGVSGTTAGCITGAPNTPAGRNTPTVGDVADENQCGDVAGNNTACPGSVTPGGVQFVFTNSTSSCLSEAGGGGVWVFGGKQYDFIVVYSSNSTCSGSNANKVTGGSGTSYIGALYFPNTSITLAGNGQSAIANQLIAQNVTIDGSSGVTIVYNPNYVPTPPAGRLVV